MSRDVRSDGGERVDSALEGFRQFIFVENKMLMNEMNTQGIGSFETLVKTNAYRSTVAGPGIWNNEARVGDVDPGVVVCLSYDG